MKSKLSILLFALVAMIVASCTHDIPEPDTQDGDIVIIDATITQEDTRVAYNDGTLKLSWEANDQLLLVGFDGTTYKGHSTFTWTETGNQFSGTKVPGATTYKAYYPASAITVDANGNVALSADFVKQTQNGDNSTAHLSGKLFLNDTGANALTEPFILKAQSSIIKFVLSNIPSDIGVINKLIWTVETVAKGTQWASLDVTGASSGATSLTAFLSFDPDNISIAQNGNIKITLIGSNKSYEYSATATNQMDYLPGKRYTATVGGTWNEARTQFCYTITTTEANYLYEIWQLDDSSISPANLTIDWGDGSREYIAKDAPLANTIASHTYVSAGNYTITITSDQVDPTVKQMPQITFYNGDGDKYLTSIIDPFPNMEATDFSYCFQGCTGLTAIPAGLFNNNTKAIIFEGCFQVCTGLTAIPAGLFSNNTKATDFSFCFDGCTGLTGANAIPAELFNSNTQATDFNLCFRDCTGLTAIPAGLFSNNTEATYFSYCFQGCTGLTAIPAGLFSNNTKATYFSYCFVSCTGLTAIPAGLFNNNTEATSFSYCFWWCSELTEIPAGLFSNNTQATTFKRCFENCTKLQLRADIFPDPATNPDFFAGKNMNFEAFFKNAGTSAATPGTAPKLWEFNKGGATWTTTGCFNNANVTNSSDIPNDWK